MKQTVEESAKHKTWPLAPVLVNVRGPRSDSRLAGLVEHVGTSSFTGSFLFTLYGVPTEYQLSLCGPGTQPIHPYR
jgi:hypothetical protein